jgi:hypothetical protein
MARQSKDEFKDFFESFWLLKFDLDTETYSDQPVYFRGASFNNDGTQRARNEIITGFIFSDESRVIKTRSPLDIAQYDIVLDDIAQLEFKETDSNGITSIAGASQVSGVRDVIDDTKVKNRLRFGLGNRPTDTIKIVSIG